MKNEKMDEFVRVGHLLIEKKRLSTGDFIHWMDSSLPLGKRQCQRMMRLARNEQLCKGCHSLGQAMRMLNDYDEHK